MVRFDSLRRSLGLVVGATAVFACQTVAPEGERLPMITAGSTLSIGTPPPIASPVPGGQVTPRVPGGRFTPPGPFLPPSPTTSVPPPSGPTLALAPQTPCLGAPVTLVGRGLPAARRATAWLLPGYRQIPEDAWGDATSPPAHAVQVGDAVVDVQGEVHISFVAEHRMGPTTSGGDLVLSPGESPSLRLIVDAPAEPVVVWGEMSFGSSGEGCPPVQMPARPRVSMEPAFPCAGDQVTVAGEGFAGAEAIIEWKSTRNRFGEGDVVRRTARVDGTGRWQLTFGLDDAKLPDGRPFFVPDAHIIGHVFDLGTHRRVDLAVPVCNTALRDALAARSVAFEVGPRGWMEPPPDDGPPLEALVFGSSQERDEILARFRMAAEFREQLLARDLTQGRGVLVVARREDFAMVEVVGVEDAGDSWLIHTVAWRNFGPGWSGTTFHYVSLPRSTRPIRFAPIATGRQEHRPLLLPDAGAF